MQVNKEVPTIEAELLKALNKVGAIEDCNMDAVQKIKFQRCARTDKGVHALGQVVSANLILPPECDSISEPSKVLASQLNELLPDQIRVWGHVRTNDKFDAKNACDGRVYEYMLPTYCLRPFSEGDHQKFDVELTEEKIDVLRDRFKNGVPANTSKEVNDDDIDAQDGEGQDEVQQNETPSSNAFAIINEVAADEMKEIRSYRLPTESLSRFRSVLKDFEGTHCYHNFTIGRPNWNKSSHRHMVSLTCSDPFVQGTTEWISINIQGQSFMLHQIRKMIGYSILVMRANAPISIFRELTKAVRVNIPKAPSLGLFLRRPLFDFHDQRTDKLRKLNPQCIAGHVDFAPYESEMNDFCKKWIYEKIVEEEESKSAFESWMRFILTYGEQFAYIRQDGSIPECYKEFATIGVYDPARDTKTARKKQQEGIRPWQVKRQKKLEERAMKELQPQTLTTPIDANETKCENV